MMTQASPATRFLTIKNSMLGLLGIFAIVASQFGGGYMVYLINLVCIFTLVSIGLNLLVGFSGQISLGHAGFFAIGAYASGLLGKNLDMPFWLSIPLGSMVATAIGALIALPALRLKNLYLAIATLGFGIVTQKLIFEWRAFTGGGGGLQVPLPKFADYDLSDGRHMFWAILFCLVIGAWMANKVAHGRTGRALAMLRESEVAAGCLGIRISHYKVIAFALSALYAAIAGGLYAYLVRYINPESFNTNMSIMFLAMIVIGGMGSIPGALMGAAFYVIVPELLRGFKEAPGLVFGLSLVAVMVLMPTGLIGIWRKFEAKKS